MRRDARARIKGGAVEAEWGPWNERVRGVRGLGPGHVELCIYRICLPEKKKQKQCTTTHLV